MSENSSVSRSALITAAGVVIFFAAGIATMLFFPDREQSKIIQPELNSVSTALISEIQSEEPKPETKKVQENSDWYVYVTGEVKNPGYYKISPDSRIFHAIEVAGGFTGKADQTSVNMASKLVDGFQINVSEKGAKKSNSNSNVRVPGLQPRPSETIVITQESRRNVKNDGKININSASAKDLEQLKGIGPAIAKRIVEYRNAHGKFSGIEDLLKVKGIGKAKLEQMRPQILIQ